MADKKLKIAGISGSLRKGSYNSALLRAAVALAPKEMEIEIVGIGDLPLFNQDLEANMPNAVVKFKEKVKNADAVLFVTPEYNYSIPGVLKNAIDWVSRPYGNNSLEGKPVAVMSASGGMLGGSRAQYHLRQTFVFLDAHSMNRPEIMVPFAPKKFSQDGELADEETKTKIKEFLQAVVVWTKKIKSF